MCTYCTWCHFTDDAGACLPHPMSLGADFGGCCGDHYLARLQQTQGGSSSACPQAHLQVQGADSGKMFAISGFDLIVLRTLSAAGQVTAERLSMPRSQSIAISRPRPICMLPKQCLQHRSVHNVCNKDVVYQQVLSVLTADSVLACFLTCIVPWPRACHVNHQGPPVPLYRL